MQIDAYWYLLMLIDEVQPGFLLSEPTSGVSSVIFLINRAISYLKVPLLGNLSKFTKRKIKIKRSIREELKKSLEPKSWNEILSCILFCLSLLFSSSWTTVYLSKRWEWNDDTVSIVGKKWDHGILDPGLFSAQIRKVEARLGKLANIRKVETN